MRTYAFRLRPGQDLREEIDKFVKDHDIKAGVVVSCVGSLKKAVLRMAGAEETKTFEGPFEIVSLVGTIEVGNRHLHIAISNKEGNVFGGHLKEGCIIETTAEVVIGELEGVIFTRRPDPETGYDELVVEEDEKYIAEKRNERRDVK